MNAKSVGQKDRFYKLTGLIALAGLVLRLIVSFQICRHDPAVVNPPLVTDMATYLNYARDILSGNMPREFYYQPFYYSVFLPAVQFFTGPSIPAVIIAQSLCGAVAVCLTGVLAARLAGRTAGYIAASLLVCSRIAIIYTPYALLETMQSFWIVLLLALTFFAWKGNHLWQWLVVGVCLSFAILSRGNAWFFLPAILLAVWYASRKKQNRKTFFAAACGVVLLGTILPQIPFSLVNSAEHGRLRGPSTAGGNVLALGNTPEAPPGGLMYPETYQLWMSREKEVSIPERILAWALEEPGAFLELQIRKVFLFWNQEEIPNNIMPEHSASCSSVLKGIHGVPTGWILVAAAAGILLSLGRCFRGKEHLQIVVLFVLLYTLAMAAFYNLARFRVPAVPIITVLAGVGVIFFFRSFRHHPEQRKAILFACAAFFVGWVIVYPGLDLYRTAYEPVLMRHLRPHGTDVPNRKGGRLIYDNGPRLIGGWQPLTKPVILKTFSPKQPIPAGTPCIFSIMLARGPGRTLISVNGRVHDLTKFSPGRFSAIEIPAVYPADNTFRIELDGNLGAAMDIQRDYGRTFNGFGEPLGAELVASVSTLAQEPEKK